MSRARTALCLLLAAGAAACVDVEQKLVVQAAGAVRYDWRLGLRNKLLTSHRAEEPAWIAEANAAAPGFVAARTERDAERTWYIVEATLPSVDAYAQFRDAFGAAFREHYQSVAAWMLPPELTRDDYGLRVSVQVEGSGVSREQPPAVSDDHWRLSVDLPGEPVGVPPDRKEGRTWIWERPTMTVLRDGLDIDVVTPKASTPWRTAMVLGAAALVTALVAGGLVATRRLLR